MKTPLRLALVGDYHPDIVAHQAIPLAIDDAAAVLEQPVKYDWLATPSIVSGEALAEYDAVWVVPGSRIVIRRGPLLRSAMPAKTASLSSAPAAAFSTR